MRGGEGAVSGPQVQPQIVAGRAHHREIEIRIHCRIELTRNDCDVAGETVDPHRRVERAVTVPMGEADLVAGREVALHRNHVDLAVAVEVPQHQARRRGLRRTRGQRVVYPGLIGHLESLLVEANVEPGNGPRYGSHRNRLGWIVERWIAALVGAVPAFRGPGKGAGKS